MLSRNRSTCGVTPFVRATCNPDADSWVAKFIEWWIDQETGYPIPERSGKIRWFIRRDEILHWANTKQELWERFNLVTDEERAEPRSVTFIMSKLQDNQELLKVNPQYLANLKALSQIERERLLNGNWKIKAAAGLFFKRTQVGDILQSVPLDVIEWVRCWDLAATEKTVDSGDPAFTAGVLMGKRKNGRYVVADVINKQMSASDVRQTIKLTAQADKARYQRVKVRLPKDPGQAGMEEFEMKKNYQNKTNNLVQAELSRRTSKNKKMDSAITEQGKYSGKFALSELLVCGSCGSAYRRNSKVAKGKTTYYWRCVNRVEHGTKYCKDSAGVEEKMLQESICRCLSKMLEDSQEVYSLIQSNLAYAVSGNSAALDMHLIETQMKQVKQDADNMMEKMSKTEGSTELYEKALSELFEQLVALRTQYEQARAQSEQSESVNAEVQRILNILQNTQISFTEYDDLTVRRLVECIQVCGKEKIIVTLKGGYQAEEELRRNDA